MVATPGPPGKSPRGDRRRNLRPTEGSLWRLTVVRLPEVNLATRVATARLPAGDQRGPPMRRS